MRMFGSPTMENFFNESTLGINYIHGALFARDSYWICRFDDSGY